MQAAKKTEDRRGSFVVLFGLSGVCVCSLQRVPYFMAPPVFMLCVLFLRGIDSVCFFFVREGERLKIVMRGRLSKNGCFSASGKQGAWKSKGLG